MEYKTMDGFYDGDLLFLVGDCVEGVVRRFFCGFVFSFRIQYTTSFPLKPLRNEHWSGETQNLRVRRYRNSDGFLVISLVN